MEALQAEAAELRAACAGHEAAAKSAVTELEHSSEALAQAQAEAERLAAALADSQAALDIAAAAHERSQAAEAGRRGEVEALTEEAAGRETALAAAESALAQKAQLVGALEAKVRPQPTAPAGMKQRLMTDAIQS